ncbi:hypothetical protein MCETHM1_02288 [Flavobacteriaceae bacterium]
MNLQNKATGFRAAKRHDDSKSAVTVVRGIKRNAQ